MGVELDTAGGWGSMIQIDRAGLQAEQNCSLNMKQLQFLFDGEEQTKRYTVGKS